MTESGPLKPDPPDEDRPPAADDRLDEDGPATAGPEPRYVPDDAWQPAESARREGAGSEATPEKAAADARTGAESSEPHGPGEDRQSFYSAALGRYGNWPTVVGFILVSILAANVIGVIVSLPALLQENGRDILADSFTLAILILLQAIVFVGVVYVFLIRRGVTTWAAMGFGEAGPGNAFLKGTGYGLLFILLASAVGVLQSVLLGLEQEQALPFDLEGISTAGMIAVVIGGVILAPVSEEIFFRGYIFRAMASRKGVARGVIYSSLLFGAIHLIRDWPPDFSPLLPIAIGSTVLAIAYHRSKTIWTPIVAHAVNNAFAFSVLFLAG